MHGTGERLPDGRLILLADQVERWDHQIATAFANLSGAEKESDRDQVRRHLPTLVRILAERNGD